MLARTMEKKGDGMPSIHITKFKIHKVYLAKL